MTDCIVHQRYTYIKDDLAIETVVNVNFDDRSISTDTNILPIAAPLSEDGIISGPTVTAQPLMLSTPPPTITERAKPAASSGFKAGLASFGGMLAAGLLYVQENFGSITDISLKNILLIGGGAVVSGLLYFLYRFYKPHTP